MGLKNTKVLPNFEGIPGANQTGTATLRLPIGSTYHQVLVSYGNLTPAQMTELRIVANGKAIQRFTSGTQLDTIMKYEGRASATADNILIVDFDRFGLRTRAAEELTSLGTGDPNDQAKITTLALEIDITAGAYVPTLSAKAIQSAPRPSGIIRDIRNFSYTAAGSGTFEISDLPRGPLVNKILFLSSAITKLEVKRDNFTVFERLVAENNRVQSDGVRVPQTGVFVYDTTEDGNGADALATEQVNDLRFILTLSAPGAIPVVVEYLNRIDR